MFGVGIAPSEDVELESVVKYVELQSQNFLLPLIKALEGKGLTCNFQRQKFVSNSGDLSKQIWSKPFAHIFISMF